jgi:hypothetical protein
MKCPRCSNDSFNPSPITIACKICKLKEFSDQFRIECGKYAIYIFKDKTISEIYLNKGDFIVRIDYLVPIDITEERIENILLLR